MAYSTIQSGAHQYNNENLTKYSLMMGGLNVTHDVLAQYDPLITGYGRLFMVRKPEVLTRLIGKQFKKFKHILEYGNTGVQGLNDVTVDFEQISGGYAGRSFEIPKVAKDDQNTFTVTVFELSGSPIREVLHTWINVVTDIQSGFAHYGGLIASGDLDYSQANHTAEFIYVVTDRTGMRVEYACMYANCFPGGYKNSQFNYQQGEHNYVETEIEFHCTKYESVDVNLKAKKLLQNYQVLVNSIEFNSGLGDVISDKNEEFTKSTTYYNGNTGLLDKGSEQNKPTSDYFFTSVTNAKMNETVTGEDKSTIKMTPSYTNAGNKKTGSF